MFKLLKKLRIKFFCNKDKHKWEYVIWGNAIIRDSEKRATMCEISTRMCDHCDTQQYFLKNGWENARKLTIDDL